MDDKTKTDDALAMVQQGRCPECGAPLAHESGCVTCYNCGWSACE